MKVPWEIGTRKIGDMNLEVMNKNLLDFKETMDKYNIKFVLIFGGLLGLIRENHLIPWDDDVEFACFAEDHQKIGTVIEELKEKGFYIPDRNICPLHDHFFIRGGEKIELWWFQKIGKEWVYDNIVRYPQIYFDTLEEKEYLGINWKVPSNPELFLEITYGKDWKIPNKEGEYILGKNPIKKLKVARKKKLKPLSIPVQSPVEQIIKETIPILKEEKPIIKEILPIKAKIIPIKSPKIAIVIPTYQRIQKLERCIKSIYINTYKNYQIYIYADNNDKNTYYYLDSKYHQIRCQINDSQKFVVGSWNRFFKEQINDDWNIVMWLVDDVKLSFNCIQNAVNCMQDNFPDLDGVVGLSQECPDHPEYTYKEYGQVLIGREFIERYKEVGYQVCCPYYTHFWQDEELYQYANSLNKFVHCKNANLRHYHPGFIKEERDNTHLIVRKEIIQKDTEIYNNRKKRNLVWGQSWEK